MSSIFGRFSDCELSMVLVWLIVEYWLNRLFRWFAYLDILQNACFVFGKFYSLNWKEVLTMAFIRAIEAIAKKFAQVTPGRTADYEFGVRNPRRDWATAAAAAEGAYEAGVTQAIAKKRFGKGVKAAGTSTWQEGAIQKGTARWGAGVTLSMDKYARNFAPYRDAIERVTLPPRYARRDPRNLDRVKAIVNALVAAKEQRLGAS